MANRANLPIYEGDDWSASVTVTNPDGTPFNLAGYTAQAQIRRGLADTDNVIVATITAAVQTPNTVNLSLTHTQATNLAGVYNWDLQITSSTGAITTLLAGQVQVTQQVTI